MPNDTWHKHFALSALSMIFMFYYFIDPIGTVALGVFAVGYLWAAWMLNPDTFTPSASQNNWGPFKFIWKNRFYRFTHHGISHNPLLWICTLFIVWVICTYFNYNSMYVVFTLGIVVNAMLHLICDFLMIVCHKSKLPILKNI